MKSNSWKFLLPVLILNIISLATLYVMEPILPYEYNYFVKQVLGIVFGLLVAFIIIQIDLINVKRVGDLIYYALYIILILLIFAPPIFDDVLIVTANEARGWFRIPILGITFQPVEFMKVAMVYKLAFVTYEHINSEMEDQVLYIKFFIYAVIPIFLVLLQPDLGGAIMLFFPAFIILLVGVENKQSLIRVLLVFIIIGTFTFALALFPAGQEFLVNYTPLKSYQLERINAWILPFETSTGYQLSQSLTVIGSSGLFGTAGEVPTIYIPESHTDFIFAQIVAIFGLVTGFLVIFLYGYLIYKIIGLTSKTANGVYKLLVLGYSTLFIVQVSENIGMLLGVFPITGIVLPFVSYGVSAMITYYGILGILININQQPEYGVSYKRR